MCEDVPILLYGSKTMVRRKKERFRIMALQIDNLRVLQGIKRMYREPNAWMNENGGSDDEPLTLTR